MFKTTVVPADFKKSCESIPKPDNECRITKATAEEMNTMLREKYGDKFKEKTKTSTFKKAIGSKNK